MILKTLAITNLDATPVIPNTIGEGAPGYVTVIDGSVQGELQALANHLRT